MMEREGVEELRGEKGRGERGSSVGRGRKKKTERDSGNVLVKDQERSPPQKRNATTIEITNGNSRV